MRPRGSRTAVQDPAHFGGACRPEFSLVHKCEVRPRRMDVYVGPLLVHQPAVRSREEDRLLPPCWCLGPLLQHLKAPHKAVPHEPVVKINLDLLGAAGRILGVVPEAQGGNDGRGLAKVNRDGLRGPWVKGSQP